MGSNGELSVCAHLSLRPLHQCTAESWGKATRFVPSRSHSTQNGEEGARSPGRLLWLLSQQHWRAQADPTERTSPPGLLQVLLTSKSLFPPPIGMSSYPEKEERASLVAQWLGICLPMQGTRVRALVWEDPTCRGATKPVSHNC